MDIPINSSILFAERADIMASISRMFEYLFIYLLKTSR